MLGLFTFLVISGWFVFGTHLPPETNLASLRAALDVVPGSVGLNQHEGSVASLSVPLSSPAS